MRDKDITNGVGWCGNMGDCEWHDGRIQMSALKGGETHTENARMSTQENDTYDLRMITDLELWTEESGTQLPCREGNSNLRLRPSLRNGESQAR
jgi:hypothetical protein